MDLLCVMWMEKERQLQLIRELLISDGNGNSVHLSEEQRSALAFLNSHSQASQAAKNNLNSSQRSTPKHTITQEVRPAEDKWWLDFVIQVNHHRWINHLVVGHQLWPNWRLTGITTKIYWIFCCICCLWIRPTVILFTVPVGMGFLCDEDSQVEKTSEKSESCLCWNKNKMHWAVWFYKYNW